MVLLKPMKSSIPLRQDSWFKVLQTACNRHASSFTDGSPLKDKTQREFFALPISVKVIKRGIFMVLETKIIVGTNITKSV